MATRVSAPQERHLPELARRRLDLAGTRGFTTEGAGAARRLLLAEQSYSWLRDLWAGATNGRAVGVSLAAVGSLSRGDAGPLSDLDLVLLHDGRTLDDTAVNALADRVWYPLWDSGQRLDHSVRTVAQCRQIAAKDLSAVVGLLDLRWVAGDEDVVAAARATVGHDWRSGARRRLPQLLESIRARHDRMGDLAHLLEPDLKESRGGLRDMSVLRALTSAWLADRPHGEVDLAYSLLLDVRDALHVVTGRGRDRLSKQEQDAVAALTGMPDADAMLTGVAESARTIAFALDTTTRRAGQAQRARTLRVGPRRPQLNPLGYGPFKSDGEVVLGARANASPVPHILLRTAVAAARAGLPIAPTSLERLVETAGSMPDPWPSQARELFTDLLAAGPGLVAVWEALDLAGVIATWLPQWSAVRSRPQRNPVHRHTVDRHLVETVVEAANLVRGVARPDLLLLAALLHDIGKVAGARDHAAQGAPVAREVVAAMGMSDQECDTVELLVRQHLSLIDLATRRDPTDPATVAAVLEAVEGGRETLELLRALTEADARATGSAAWTDWRATLLGRLTVGARRAIGVAPVETAPETPMDVPTDAAYAVLAGESRVIVTDDEGTTRLEVFDRDRLGLFADIAGVLAAQGFVVRSASVRSLEHGLAANTWYVDSSSGEQPDHERIEAALRRLATGDRAPLQLLARRSRRGRPAGSAELPGPARPPPAPWWYPEPRPAPASWRSAPLIVPGCCTTSAWHSPAPASTSAAPTSLPTPGRALTPSTSARSGAPSCRRPGWPRSSRC